MVALTSDKLRLLRGKEGREHLYLHHSNSTINSLSNISKIFSSSSYNSSSYSSSLSLRDMSMDHRIETITSTRCMIFQNRHRAMTSLAASDKVAVVRPSETILVMWSPQGLEALPLLPSL